jgi:hypothetical protein
MYRILVERDLEKDSRHENSLEKLNELFQLYLCNRRFNSVEPTHFEITIELSRADMAFYQQDDFESRHNTIKLSRADIF